MKMSEELKNGAFADFLSDLEHTLGLPIDMDDKDPLGAGLHWLVHDTSPPDFQGLRGSYNHWEIDIPVINIYLDGCNSLEDVVWTAIHEYIHFLQPDVEDAVVLYRNGEVDYKTSEFRHDCLEYDAEMTSAQLFPEFWFKHFGV